MRYIDKFPNCVGCPVFRYCGLMVSSGRLCNSYKEEQNVKQQKTTKNEKGFS